MIWRTSELQEATRSHFTAHRDPSGSRPKGQAGPPTGWQHMERYRSELVLTSSCFNQSIYLFSQAICCAGLDVREESHDELQGPRSGEFTLALNSLTSPTPTDGTQYGPRGWLLGNEWTCLGWELWSDQRCCITEVVAVCGHSFF